MSRLTKILILFPALMNAQWLSTLDLRSGYHQVVMDSKDADKTSFVTRREIYLWRVMPFGLCDATATFQRMMDIVLSGLNFEVCLVYLEYVIVLDRHGNNIYNGWNQYFNGYVQRS